MEKNEKRLETITNETKTKNQPEQVVYFDLLDTFNSKLIEIIKVWSFLYSGTENDYTLDDFEIDADDKFIIVYISNNKSSCGYDETSFKIPIDFLSKSNEEIQTIWEREILIKRLDEELRIEKQNKKEKQLKEENERKLYESLKLKYDNL